MSENSVNTILGSAGAGEQFEALGKTWSLSPASYGAQAAYEAWLKLRARKDLIAQRGELGEAYYREEMKSLNQSINAGKYNWGESVFAESLETGSGQRKLLQILLAEKHGEVSDEEIRRLMRANPEGVSVALQAALRAGDPNLFGGESENPASN